MPNCTKCQRPTKGHPLPWGLMCTMDTSNGVFCDLDPLQNGTSLQNFPDGGGARPKVVTTRIDHWPPVNMATLPPSRRYKLVTFDDSDTEDAYKDFDSGFTSADVLKNFVDEAAPNVHSREMDKVETCLIDLKGEFTKMAKAMECLAKCMQEKESKADQQASAKGLPPVSSQQASPTSMQTSTTTTYALPTPLSANQLPTTQAYYQAPGMAHGLPPNLSAPQPAGFQVPPTAVSSQPVSSYPPTNHGTNAYHHQPPTAPPPGFPHSTTPVPMSMQPASAQYALPGRDANQGLYTTATSTHTMPIINQDYTAPTYQPYYADTTALGGDQLIRPGGSSPQWQLPAEDVIIGDCVIPREVAVAALQGHYADLSKFIMSPNPACEQDKISISRSGKHLTVTNKLAPRPIHNYQMWTMAWANYEELLMRYLPYTFNMYSKCAEYKRLIHSWQAKYKWPAVFVYDTKFRVNRAKSKSLDFDSFDGRLFSTIFDPTTIRTDAPRCFRCQSIEHHINDCPFPKEPKAEKGKETKREDEICFNYNRNKCFTSACTRRHVCRNCQGPKPASTCGCQANGGN